jgi:fumarate reductase subunit D
MQMLGVQVLFGFWFQGIFQEGFDDVSALGRRIAALALALMVVVLGCLIAVPCQHRIVEHGMSTVRVQRVATRFADLALLWYLIPLILRRGTAHTAHQ